MIGETESNCVMKSEIVDAIIRISQKHPLYTISAFRGFELLKQELKLYDAL